ncbi:methyltransferase [Mycobacterium angelicum]|uniref:Hydroxyneurosporene methyltransferase n=1 Tax=Mycobacterium angelicum TaxID=470074 RepID=A0A1X0A213_MYCAN|nr:methyltransferase [Mycobacterium angelicum]MCV7195346.1 hydroxyneurosporene methyltransferase [Mycobacterium angelicum]ORA23915.1 hydroxyneurosporene methyltransferase [Mycobacterium angelicum]
MDLLKISSVKAVRPVEAARHYLARLRQRMAPPQAALMEMILSAWSAQAIAAAADLGIADALAKGPMSARELAAAVSADADAVSRLMRALIGHGIFRQRRDGRYALTPLGDPLRSDAKMSVRGMARWVGTPQEREHWSQLTQAIRTGHSVVEELRGKVFFDYLSSEPDLAAIFNQAMTSTSELAVAPVVAAYDFSAFATVVDVGGGHGRLLAAVLTAAPHARGILFDQPKVVSGASSVLSEHHVTDRVQIAEGSFFDDDIPSGGDAYVLKFIIHDWTDDDAVRILRNVRAAAGAGKKVLLVEQVIPEHNRDFLGKWLDLEMLVLGSARERTAAEYEQLLSRAGLQMTRVIETVSPFGVIEAVAN